MKRVHIDFIPDFNPGDPPPEGYLAWHEWAQVQMDAGLKQMQCVRCGKWIFPQEGRSELCEIVFYKTKRDAMRETNPFGRVEECRVCSKCDR